MVDCSLNTVVAQRQGRRPKDLSFQLHCERPRLWHSPRDAQDSRSSTASSNINDAKFKSGTNVILGALHVFAIFAIT